MNIEAEHKSLLICKGELICGNFPNDQIIASMNTQLLSLMVSYLLQKILYWSSTHIIAYLLGLSVWFWKKGTLQLWSPYWLNFWITKKALEWLRFFQVWWRLASESRPFPLNPPTCALVPTTNMGGVKQTKSMHWFQCLRASPLLYGGKLDRYLFRLNQTEITQVLAISCSG